MEQKSIFEDYEGFKENLEKAWREKHPKQPRRYLTRKELMHHRPDLYQVWCDERV